MGKDTIEHLVRKYMKKHNLSNFSIETGKDMYVVEFFDRDGRKTRKITIDKKHFIIKEL